MKAGWVRWARAVSAIPVYAQLGVRGFVGSAGGGRQPLVIVQAVILADEGVLLAVRNDLRGWELPGGRPEEGESPEGALRREIREETGLELAVDRYVGDYVRSGFWPHTARVYRGRVAGGCLRTSDENRRLAWFGPEELPETLFPWYRQPLRDALASRTDVVQRSETLGWKAIADGMRIDLRMRVRGDGAFGGGSAGTR